jgi:murein DD-endopeptidase MepM/ murein hydrolase activator NlpD
LVLLVSNNVARVTRTNPRRLVAVAALAAALVPVVTVAPAGADKLDDLRSEVLAAQAASDAVVARYTEAENRLGALEVEIEDLEAAVKADRATVADLRVIARRRAIEAYIGRSAMAPLGFSGDPMRDVRRQTMLAQLNARDDAQIARLNALTADLTIRQASLRGLRDDARTLRDQFEVETTALQGTLTTAKQSLTAYEEELRRAEAARRELERARLAVSRAPTGGGRDYTGAYVALGIVCPIRGAVSFIDSWGAPRATTGFHYGVDLMSPRGTPNVAVVAGDVEMHSGSVSGLGVWLHGDDGNLYYYFHLEAYEGGSRRVQQGDVVGYTGNTGDASGGATHTHFEVHPGGGAAVNPYPSVARVC